jgi:pyruvate dehydrogenase E1 component alpha subunit
MATAEHASRTTPADLERLYRSLFLIRHAEEEIARIYPSDKIKSPVHLSLGQEAVSVGVCDVLRPDDVVSPTYRSHAAFMAMGGDLRAMFAELYGKATGVADGKGGSMHLIDMSHHVLGASAVVGTTIPLACGYALAIQRRREDRVVVSFFGDGATEEGAFHESLNFAALHRLPVLFVCENNGFAIHTPISRRWATDKLCERVETYGIPAVRLAEDDVLALRAQAAKRVGSLRAGAGPAFIECVTYRWREHVGPGEDYEAGYRSRSELERSQKNDQVTRIGSMLDQSTRAAVERAVRAEVAAAIDFAERSPFPGAAELLRHTYASTAP